MILYPAIDLKDGRAVRLVHGEMDQETVFNENPAAQALEFVAAGCEWLHLVDLNGAFAGEPVNAAPSKKSLRSAASPPSLAAASATWPQSSAGSVAASPASSLARLRSKTLNLCATQPANSPAKLPLALTHATAKSPPKAGLKRPMSTPPSWPAASKTLASPRSFTPTSLRDGAMKGPNVEATAALGNAVSIPVIASGGVSSLADLTALKSCGAPLNGAISGRALYDGAIDLKEALTLMQS